jgi:CheY-like chemotaxis protein
MAKIMLVDDEPDIVFLIKKILEKGGHEVVEAYNGEEALKRTKKENPDLILLDIMMPGISGWEVSRKIKTGRDTMNIPVVMLTVRTSEDSVEKSFEYSYVDAHLGKPTSGKKILETLNSILNN